MATSTLSAYGPLRWYDYFLFVAILLISMGIGVYFALSGGRQRTTGEYLTGSRRLNSFAVTLSIFMSSVSGIIVLGNSAESYEYGMITFMDTIFSQIMRIFSTLLYVPLLYSLRLTSVYEYFELRFGSKIVRIIGTILLCVTQLFLGGMALYAPSVALESVTGLASWISMLVMGVVVTIYTTIGGLQAVVWTDVFQGLVLMAGAVTVLVMGTIEVGGPAEVWNIAKETGRLNWVDFTPDPFLRTTTWAAIISQFFQGMVQSTAQVSVQRYGNTKSKGAAMCSFLVQAPLWIFIALITLLSGLVIFAHYHKLGCDVLKTDQVQSSNELFLYFIVNVLAIPAFPGLMLAVLYSGAISTMSSSINSCTAVVWKDLLEHRLTHLQENTKTGLNKAIVCIFGIVSTGLAFVFLTFSGNFMQIARTLIDGLGSPLVGLWWLALFPWVNWIGAIAGAISSFAFVFVLTFMNNYYNPYSSKLNSTTEECWKYNVTVEPPGGDTSDDVFALFKLSFTFYPAIGIVSCIVVGLLVSLLTGKWYPPVKDPRYNVPVFDWVCCCLPSRLLKKCWCGVPYDQLGDHKEVEASVGEETKSISETLEETNLGYDDKCDLPEETTPSVDPDSTWL